MEALKNNAKIDIAKETSELISKYLERFPDEKSSVEKLQIQISTGSDIASRKNYDGHLTATAVIINSNREILLINHNALHKWLFPGGHYDENEHIWNTSMREATEETGINDLEFHEWHVKNGMIPMNVNTHPIPENRGKKELAHQHHDFNYVLVSKSDATSIAYDEVSAAKWFGAEQVSEVAVHLDFEIKKLIRERIL